MLRVVMFPSKCFLLHVLVCYYKHCEKHQKKSESKILSLLSSPIDQSLSVRPVCPSSVLGLLSNLGSPLSIFIFPPCHSTLTSPHNSLKPSCLFPAHLSPLSCSIEPHHGLIDQLALQLQQLLRHLLLLSS